MKTKILFPGISAVALFGSLSWIFSVYDVEPGVPFGGVGGMSEKMEQPAEEGRESLWAALSTARLAIQPLSKVEAEMGENRGVRYFAANAGEDLTARFLDGGMKLASGNSGRWEAVLRFSEASNVRPIADGNRVEYGHANGITEWYVNRSQGIEHGFTVERRLSESPDSGQLRLEMMLEGASSRLADDSGKVIEFISDATGAAVVRYDGLKAWDATGKSLAARMEASGASFSLVVADEGAVYPLTIDPIITSLEAKLRPVVTGDGAPDDHFGSTISLDGDFAVIGAPDDDQAVGANAGGAYVFARVGGVWSLQTKLVSGETGAGDQFGHSVSVSGNTILVGSMLDDTSAGPDAGSAWVFVRSGNSWIRQTKLSPGDSSADDWFGYSVAINGDTAVVGAPRHDGVEEDVGAAYLFIRNGSVWTQQARIRAGDGTYVDNFGVSVALSGNTVLVGADGDDYFFDFIGSTIYNVGSAYVFTRNGATWTQQAKLLPNELRINENSNFGRSVSLSGDTALVGSPGDSTGSPIDSGTAYVFTRSGTAWTRQAILAASDAANFDYFGVSVSLSGETALVGSLLDDTPAGVDTGSAYVFTRSGTSWGQQAKLIAVTAAENDKAGSAVALSGNTAIIGAPNAGGAFSDDLPESSDAGSAFLFTRSGAAWSEQEELNAGDAAASDSFGSSVAIEGDMAVIGAPSDDTPRGLGAGSVYVIKRVGETWSVMAKLFLPPETFPEYSEGFGSSVAISGNTILVGVPFASGQYGRAYVFVTDGSTWTKEAVLGSVSNDEALFGLSVALEGDHAVVGAPRQSSGRGRAYIFKRSGKSWSSPLVLAAGDATQLTAFGDSVAISGETLLVGSPGECAAYVFSRTGELWTEHQKLVASDSVDSDDFGSSVALSGGIGLVGAPGSQYSASMKGSGYVFVRGGNVWSQEAKLVASDGVLGDGFGRSVDFDNGIAVIGAPFKDRSGKDRAGTGYLFSRIGGVWSQQTVLNAADGAIDDIFGSAVAISGDTVLSGAPGVDMAHPYGEMAGDTGGAAYVYRLTLPPAPQVLFDAAMQAAGLTGVQATADAKPYSDGTSNLLKYAFNMNLKAPDVHVMAAGGVSGLPSISPVQIEGQHFLRYLFVRRIGAGLGYVPMKSASLMEDSWLPVTDIPEIQWIDADWERVIYMEPYDPANAPMLFGRVAVTLP